jgi:molybdopterin-containing oxidoreductase family iron-sulfur binding subunit
MIKNLTRRAFLRLTAGGSLAFAAGGLGRQFPANWISQPLPPEYNIRPSSLVIYSTTCRECPAGCGMHVHHVNGRAIKAEGSPNHPVNRGGLCARGQSALQGLYDPDRVGEPLKRRKVSGHFPDTGTKSATWQQALRAVGSRLRNSRGRVVVVSGLETGPLVDIMRSFAENFGGRLLLFEPFNCESLRRAHARLAGAPAIPWYALDRCGSILSFAADFLETWVSNVQFAGMFSQVRVCEEGKTMGRYAYIGPRLSMTAANADDFLLVPPGAEYDVAMNILRVMAEKGWTKGDAGKYRRLTGDFRPEVLPIRDAGAKITRLAKEFAHAEGSAALAGPAWSTGGEALRLAEVVHLLNRAAGNIGDTVDFSRTHALGATAYADDLLLALAELNKEDTVIIHESNPVHVLPQMEKMLKRAGMVVSLTQMPDETSLLADWVLPVNNPLESWGEYSPWTGIRSLMQPAMQRLLDSRPAGDIFLSLADMAGRPLARNGEAADLDFTAWLHAEWQEREGDARRKWENLLPELLRAGYRETEAVLEKAPAGGAVHNQRPAQPGTGRKIQIDAGQARLWLWPSIFLYDGRTANRGWLQENPHPVSYIAWGSWADIHPGKAAVLGIREGDGVKITAGSISLQVPVRITDEIDEQTVGLILGQGHRALGMTAAGLGVNGFALAGRDADGSFFGTVSLARVKGAGRPICLTASRDQHGREVLRWEKLKNLQSGRAERAAISMPLPEGFARENDIYEGHEHAGHRWGMVIDLDRCIGCGACAVACYAENNIPVLGAGPVREGREMAWLKVVPYSHPERKGHIGFLPLPCQHCDQAPCEPVCPVFAAVHSEEGLNAQVYNRCIGTRYCSQNCPYKVRRFNWLNSDWQPPLEWQLNPEVTVRSRGVMEKCTFCVQRIRRAEYRAKLEDRPVLDGEIQPACVQSCPAGVFTFGDLHDENSKVSRLFRDNDRGYQLLHELNTKPAVLYLKKIDRG